MGIARVGERIRYEPTVMRPAEGEVRRRYPQFDQDGALEELRRSEYARLDRGTKSTSRPGACVGRAGLRRPGLREQVLGNPHSNSPASLAATALVERTRRADRKFFNARPTIICASLPLMRARRCGWWGNRIPLTQGARSP